MCSTCSAYTAGYSQECCQDNYDKLADKKAYCSKAAASRSLQTNSKAYYTKTAFSDQTNSTNCSEAKRYRNWPDYTYWTSWKKGSEEDASKAHSATTKQTDTCSTEGEYTETSKYAGFETCT